MRPLFKSCKVRVSRALVLKRSITPNLGEKSFLFLGPQTKLNSFFSWGARESRPAFFLQISKNIFNPKRVLGLVLAENAAEVTATGRKFFSLWSVQQAAIFWRQKRGKGDSGKRPRNPA